MFRLTLLGVVVSAVMAVLTPAPVSAMTYEKLAQLTFTGPVQVPGVTLNAGTYRFRLTNPDTSRNVLQVLSNDGSITYGMFNTTPGPTAARRSRKTRWSPSRKRPRVFPLLCTPSSTAASTADMSSCIREAAQT